MSWLGQGFSRESMKSMSDAYAEVQEGIDPKGAARQDAAKKKKKVDVFAYDRKIGRKTTPDGKPLPPAPKNEEVEVNEAKTNIPGAKIGGSIKKPNGKTIKVEEVEESYSVSVEDGLALEEGKKKCKDGYEWDSDEGKCVKKKKSSRTTIIVGRGYGGHHHHDDDDTDDGNDGNGGDGGGGDAGGGDGGGGGGE